MKRAALAGYSLAGVGAVVGASTSTGWPVAFSGLLCALLSIHSFGLWRAFLALFMVASILRKGFLAEHVLPGIVWYGLEALGLIGIVVTTVLQRNKPSNLPALNKAQRYLLLSVAVFGTACALSTIFSPTLVASAKRLAPLLAMLTLFSLVYIFRWRDGKTARGDILFAALVVTIATAIGLIGVAFGYDWTSSGFGRFSGVTGNANFAAEMTVLSLVIIIGYATRHDPPSIRILQVSAALILGCGLYLSGGRGAVLAGVVGVTVALWWRRDRLPTAYQIGAQVGIVLLAVLAFLPTLNAVTTSDSTANPHHTSTAATTPTAETDNGGFNRPSIRDDITSGRGEIYSELIGRFTKYPILGSGFQTTPLYNAIGMQGHNLFLQMLAETGVIGFLAMTAFLIAVAWAGRAIRHRPALLGAYLTVLVYQLTETTVFGWLSPTCILSWLIMFGLAAEAGTAATSDGEPASITTEPIPAE